MGKIKKALITGITGQDGSYLSEFLLKKNYQVYGLVRRVALEDESHRLWRIKHLLKKIKLNSASLENVCPFFLSLITLQNRSRIALLPISIDANFILFSIFDY